MKHYSLSMLFSFAVILLPDSPASAAGVSGAIFTTDANGTVVNANIYPSKCAVFLDGGPGPHAPAKAAGLPDGDYYWQVTDPDGGTLLSTDPVSNRRFRVTGGLITAYTGTGVAPHRTGIDQDHAAKGAITIQLGNNTCPDDFLNTPNSGGVYKVWATPVGSYVGNPANVDNPCGNGCFHGFVASQSKTDNFKALAAPAATFCLTVQKQFNDGSATYADLLGWGITITDALGVTNQYTTDSSSGQVNLCQLPVGTYTITENPIGPVTNSCYFDGALQTTLNGVVQSTLGTVSFNWNSNAPVNVTFVTAIFCTQ
jgi:hypothetical protein